MLCKSSYAMAENVFAVTQSDIHRPSGPARIWVDGQRFRAECLIAPVPEGTPTAMSFVSSGRLLPNNEVRIMSDTGAILPEGGVGEILIKSNCLFEGYYNRPDLTAEAIVAGWYHSGDLGFYLDGELYVVGRKKDLLIIGGENIYPQDIEEVVCSHSAIHDGTSDCRWAYTILTSGRRRSWWWRRWSRRLFSNNAAVLEREIRSQVVAASGVAVRSIFLKPPKWIVKSTAGKAARSATREKLLKEHPELSAGS